MDRSGARAFALAKESRVKLAAHWFESRFRRWSARICVDPLYGTWGSQLVDKVVQWNLGIELVKEGAKAMRYIWALQDRASDVVKVLENDFEAWVL